MDCHHEFRHRAASTSWLRSVGIAGHPLEVATLFGCLAGRYQDNNRYRQHCDRLSRVLRNLAGNAASLEAPLSRSKSSPEKVARSASELNSFGSSSRPVPRRLPASFNCCRECIGDLLKAKALHHCKPAQWVFPFLALPPVSTAVKIPESFKGLAAVSVSFTLEVKIQEIDLKALFP